jgi:hypothetical protein
LVLDAALAACLCGMKKQVSPLRGCAASVEMTSLGGVEESGSRFARMPTHAMKLHEWSTQGS